MDEWRSFLYPIGYISALAFAFRFLLQWIASERKQRSLVTRSFWFLSVIGNSFHIAHTFVQVQFPVCLVQTIALVISLRNLDLMQERRRPLRFSSVLLLLFSALTIMTSAFALRSYLCFNGELHWFLAPQTPWYRGAAAPISLWWNLLGTCGVFLFASRFWIQWWEAEAKQKSHLGVLFWYFSLAGAALSSLYFFQVRDPVNMLGPAFGFLPYVRNLVLLKREQAKSYGES